MDFQLKKEILFRFNNFKLMNWEVISLQILLNPYGLMRLPNNNLNCNDQQHLLSPWLTTCQVLIYLTYIDYLIFLAMLEESTVITAPLFKMMQLKQTETK